MELPKKKKKSAQNSHFIFSLSFICSYFFLHFLFAFFLEFLKYLLADAMVGYWCRVGSQALTHTRTDIFGAVAIWDQQQTMLSIFVVPPTARLHQGCWLCFTRVLPGLVAAPLGVRAGSGPLARSRLRALFTTGLFVCSECMLVTSCIGPQSPA